MLHGILTLSRPLFLQGYALVEYETKAEAQAAITGASGSQMLEQTLQCDFAFTRPPVRYVTELWLHGDPQG